MQVTIRGLLEIEFKVSAVIGRGDTVIPKLEDEVCDALVLDVSLPGCSGLQLLPMLRTKWPGLGIVVLTTHDDARYRTAAMERGADAYVGKQNAVETLVPALRMAIAARRNRGYARLQR